ETAVIVGTPGRGWDEEGPEAHNCDAMGCATIGPHVLARVPFTDGRALSQKPEAQAQDGGEVYMEVTVRDGAWVGTYAEWCRRKRNAPPSAPEAVVEAVARAICVACEENPDHQGDARGNEFRWQDYRDTALAAINALTAAQQQGKPAVVDEAMVERATMALLGKSHDTAPGVDWRCDRTWTVNKVRKHMRTALAAALAAKHQEPPHDHQD